MSRIKLSIIVPVYNVEKYLTECITSLIEKCDDSFEIILIDDGSTDNSGIICDEFKKKSSIIKVIHQENRGLSGARNTGIRHSTGEYLMFVDSDDYLYKEFNLKKNGCLFVGRCDTI